MSDPPLRVEEIRNAMLDQLIGREIQLLETTQVVLMAGFKSNFW